MKLLWTCPCSLGHRSPIILWEWVGTLSLPIKNSREITPAKGSKTIVVVIWLIIFCSECSRIKLAGMWITYINLMYKIICRPSRSYKTQSSRPSLASSTNSPSAITLSAYKCGILYSFIASSNSNLSSFVPALYYPKWRHFAVNCSNFYRTWANRPITCKAGYATLK